MFSQSFRRLASLLLAVGLGASVSLTVGTDAVIANGAPANDNIADAINLSSLGLQSTLSGSNLGATLEANEQLLVDPEVSYLWGSWSKSVWYRITPAPGMVEVSTIGSSFDTLLAVFTFVTPTSFGTPNLVTLSDDIIERENLRNRQSKTAFQADGTTTYYIAVGGFGESEGNITLNWAFPQPSTNDDIAQAFQLTNTGDTRTNRNNFLSDIESAESDLVQYWGIPNWTNSVWFSVQPAAGTWGVRLENFVGAQIVLLDDDDFSNESIVGWSPNAIGFRADGTRTYYIGIGAGENEQSFDIVFSSIVQPNRVTSAELNPGANTTISWPTPDNFDPQLHAFRVYLSNGDLRRYCDVTLPATCPFPRLQNGTWRVSIVPYESLHGFEGDEYAFDIDLTNISNDYFGASTSLTTDSGELTDFFDHATLETGEPTHFSSATYSTLWYSYTPTVSGTSTFNVTTTDVEASGELQPIVAAYTGTTLANLQPIASSGTSLTWQSVGGQRYFVAVASRFEPIEVQSSPFRFHTMTWSHVAAPATTAAPTTTTTVPVSKVISVKAKNNATMASILKKARIRVPKNARVTYTIAKASKKKCSVVRSRIQLKKKITCSMTVKIKPTKGKTVSHKLAINS
ncbi:MAG: hypothetical protein RIR69_299 [Actinomycetota bacterium]